MTDIQMDNIQSIQEEEYGFPYHYLPVFEGNDVKLYPHWSWGFRYLAGIELLLEKLRKMQFDSLIDVGCGDGRLLREITRQYPDKKLRGVDYSQQAIALAKAFNPGLDYRAVDIIKDDIGEPFDVITLIEVLEHIPLESADEFVAALVRLMRKDSVLLMTVPHKNQPLIPKHYRHFDSNSLLKILSAYFECREMFFFDRNSRIISAWQRLMCNKYFIIRNQRVTNAFYRYYRNNHLSCTEQECLRMGAVFTQK
jgi:cyclopropane fatty-acyl-phospholipid synthase-like methyltransferase